MNLFDLYENREPYQQSIDRLEQRRIEDLEAKMDDYARRGDKEGFQKCKAERDSYHKVKMDEGSMKQWLWKEAERMDKDAFVANADEYGMSAEEAAEWWDDINGVDESGIGQDLVTPQQRVQQATPQKQTPVQKVGSTVKHAANWLVGKGGPGKEGPTYEEAELDEQEAGPFDVVAGKNLVLLQQAWEKQLPNISLEFPGQNLTVYLPQVYSIFKHLKQMNNNKQVATVQKFFGDRQDFLMWMNSIKQLQIPTKAQKAIKSQFAQPEPGQLDLGISETKKKDSLTTPGDPESEVAIKLARSRHPTAKSDLSALVKDKIATDKTVKKEIDQVKADNERQEKEIQSLEKETDALSIATSKASKPKNFDTDANPTTPVPPSAGAFVPAPTVSVTPSATATTPIGLPLPAPTTAKAPDLPTEPTTAKAPAVTKDKELAVSKGKEVKDKANTTKMNYRVAPQRQLGRTQRPALAGVGQAPAKDMGNLDVVPQVPAPGLDSSGDAAQLAQVASRGNRQQRFAKPKTVSIVPGNFELVDEGQVDVATPHAVYIDGRKWKVFADAKTALEMKKKVEASLKAQGRNQQVRVVADHYNITNENDDEGNYTDDPKVHAQVKRQPPALPPELADRLAKLSPQYHQDAINDYKRKHGIKEGDQIRLGDVQPGTPGYDAWYKSTHKTTPPGEKPQPAGRGDYDWTEKQKIMPKVLPEAVNPQFINAKATQLLARAAQSFKSDSIAVILAPLMKEYNLTLQQIDSMVPGGLRKAAGEYGLTVKEAANPAQQAAIAIAMKTAGKKPESVDEEKTRLDPKCWTGKKIGTPKTKVKGGVRVNNCVPAEESYTGVMESQGITDPKLLEVARKIDLFAKTIK